MNHFVEERLNRLVPAVPANVAPADDDLLLVSRLAAEGIVAES